MRSEIEKYLSCLKCKEDKELFNGQCYDTNFTCPDKNWEKCYSEEKYICIKCKNGTEYLRGITLL